MKNQIKFTKLQGTGNDFVIIDTRKLKLSNLNKLAIKLCAHKFGIGADGLLLIENSKNADFRMRIFNSDGSEAEMCGNGARCITQYAYDNKIAGRSMKFDTKAGVINAKIIDNNWVEVKLTNPGDIKLNFKVAANKKTFVASFINTGVPHTVIFLSDLTKIDINTFGRTIRYHKMFSPAGTNVNFVKVLNKNVLKIRTYERGVESETLACGTGSTAAAIISAVLNKTVLPTKVITASNETLYVNFNLQNRDSVFLTGKVKTVFHGAYYI